MLTKANDIFFEEPQLGWKVDTHEHERPNGVLFSFSEQLNAVGGEGESQVSVADQHPSLAQGGNQLSVPYVAPHVVVRIATRSAFEDQGSGPRLTTSKSPIACASGTRNRCAQKN